MFASFLDWKIICETHFECSWLRIRCDRSLFFISCSRCDQILPTRCVHILHLICPLAYNQRFGVRNLSKKKKKNPFVTSCRIFTFFYSQSYSLTFFFFLFSVPPHWKPWPFLRYKFVNFFFHARSMYFFFCVINSFIFLRYILNFLLFKLNREMDTAYLSK